MLTKETRQHIDNARNILVGQLPLPTDQVELITIALIYKFMDDIDESAKKLGGQATYFKGDLSSLSWRKIISNTLSAEERVTKFIAAIEGLSIAKNIPDLFKSIFKNTFLKFRDGRILKMFMDEINWFQYGHSEELGNAFEYLLNTMGAQGDNGQFRTPRNIIDFIVEVVDPQKEDSILDPACGTAGFLISAFKHILWNNTKGYEDYSITLNNYEIEGKQIHKGNKLTQDQRKELVKNLVGYDITPLMQRLSKVNMYLHDIPNPVIQDYDTLSLDTRWHEKYDCILANPPFMTPKGGIQPHDKFRIKANTTEVLFSDYMLEHLTPNGKAGWIVPEGIIFQNNNDYVDLRQWLVEEAGLWGVISLPAQIFQPYSGVKTSILLIDRKLARERDSIILVKIENDGFSLNTNRNPIEKNDLPGALKLLRAFKADGSVKAVKKEAGSIKHLILKRQEFEKIESYKAYTTGWELCRKAYVKVSFAQGEYEQAKNGNLTGKIMDAGASDIVFPRGSVGTRIKLTEKELERVEKIWQRKWDEFARLINYNKAELGSEAEFKTWFEENLKDACIGYGDNPKAPIKIKKGGVYFSEELKKSIDHQREYNLNFDKYTSNAKLIKDSEFELVRIADLCELVNGVAFKPEQWENEEKGGLPIVRIQNLNDRSASFNYYSGVVKEQFLIENSDLLFSWSGSKGTSFGPHIWYGKKAVLNQHIFRVLPNNKIDKHYFYWALKKLVAEVEDNLHGGVGLVHITKGNFQKLTIPLPPLEVQQKIVAEIESYQKVIDGCNAVIENYKPTFRVDEKWEKVRLGEVAKTTSGGTPLRYKTEYFTNGTIPWLKSGEVSQGYITKAEEYITEEGLNESSAKLIPPNSILVALYGATAGKVGILKFESAINQAICAVLPNNKIVPEFLYFFLKSKTEDLIKLCVGGAQQNLSQSIIQETEIPLPPIEIQQNIVEEINEDNNTLYYNAKLKSKMEGKIQEVIEGVWGK